MPLPTNLNADCPFDYIYTYGYGYNQTSLSYSNWMISGYSYEVDQAAGTLKVIADEYVSGTVPIRFYFYYYTGGYGNYFGYYYLNVSDITCAHMLTMNGTFPHGLSDTQYVSNESDTNKFYLPYLISNSPYPSCSYTYSVTGISGSLLNCCTDEGNDKYLQPIDVAAHAHYKFSYQITDQTGNTVKFGAFKLKSGCILDARTPIAISVDFSSIVTAPQPLVIGSSGQDVY